MNSEAPAPPEISSTPANTADTNSASANSLPKLGAEPGQNSEAASSAASATAPPSAAAAPSTAPSADQPSAVKQESNTASSTAQPESERSVKFENALDFLDQVRAQFAGRPKIYNKFLDIMKDFKSNAIDTPGVIKRVSDLFVGHNNLILGFNAFLPPGYKIDPNSLNQNSAPPTPAETPKPAAALAPGAAQAASGAAAAASRPKEEVRKQPEFDHARNYVKKIKLRFIDQPEVYKAFLEILHIYHKEQHTIKDVYDQVATLFQHHTDLLDEFTQFLPDPVQQAGNAKAEKKRRKQARADRGKRRRMEEKDRAAAAAAASGGMVGIHGEPLSFEQQQQLQHQHHAAVAASGHQIAGQMNIGIGGAHVSAASSSGRVVPNASYEELAFFYKLRKRLNDPHLYQEFLKCLNLFTQQIINRTDLVLLVKELLSRHPPHLFDWFKQFIGYDDASVTVRMGSEPGALDTTGQQSLGGGALRISSWNDLDWSTCDRFGISYRALPDDFELGNCSGRTPLCNSVINDKWVSMPTGNEEYGFRTSRKNQYEEMLFRCEDDRYELDLVIDLNLTLIKKLRPVVEAIDQGKTPQAAALLLGKLGVLHVGALHRTYGSRGHEVVEALQAHPALVAPVVLRRLEIKDLEWKRAKKEWDRIWREVNQKNYYRSLDYQSFSFKQTDRRNTSARALVADIKEVAQRWSLKAEADAAAEAAPSTPPTVGASAALAAASDKQGALAASRQAPSAGGSSAQSALTEADSGAEVVPMDEAGDKAAAAANNQEKVKDNEKEEQAPKSSKKLSANPIVAAMIKEMTTGNMILSPAALAVGTGAAVAAAPGSECHMEAPMGEQSLMEDLQSLVNFVAEKSLNKSDMEKIGVFFEHFMKPFFDVSAAQKRPALIYANSTIYALLRLIHLLYGRLRHARSLATSGQSRAWSSAYPLADGKGKGVMGSGDEQQQSAAGDNENAADTADAGKKPVSSKSGGAAAVKEEGAGAEAAATSASKKSDEPDPYKSFLTKVYALAMGSMEQNAYEEECRKLLGIDSYVLFTMDKLIQSLTRQLSQVLGDDLCSKLLALYSLNAELVDMSETDEQHYLRTVQRLLDESHRVFKIWFQGSSLRFYLMDSESPMQELDLLDEAATKNWVEKFMLGQDNTEQAQARQQNKQKPFLERNRKLWVNKEKEQQQVASTANADESTAAVMKDVEMKSGLEARISLDKMRLFFVAGTEDSFARRKPSTSSISGGIAKKQFDWAAKFMLKATDLGDDLTKTAPANTGKRKK